MILQYPSPYVYSIRVVHKKVRVQVYISNMSILPIDIFIKKVHLSRKQILLTQIGFFRRRFFNTSQNSSVSIIFIQLIQNIINCYEYNLGFDVLFDSCCAPAVLTVYCNILFFIYPDRFSILYLQKKYQFNEIFKLILIFPDVKNIWKSLI